MINVFIALLMLLMSYGFFSFSFMVHGLDRLLVYAPKSIFEYCVTFDDNGNVYYSEEDIKKKYLSYLDDNVGKYSKEYNASFRFYFTTSGGLCDEKCDGVEVSFSSYIAFSYTYRRTMFYEIMEVKNG